MELAELVKRETELTAELKTVQRAKAEKREEIMLAATGGVIDAVVTAVTSESKKRKVEQYVAAAGADAEVMTAVVAKELDMKPNVVSAYLGSMTEAGVLERTGRGRYRVKATAVQAPAPAATPAESGGTVEEKTM